MTSPLYVIFVNSVLDDFLLGSKLALHETLASK